MTIYVSTCGISVRCWRLKILNKSSPPFLLIHVRFTPQGIEYKAQNKDFLKSFIEMVNVFIVFRISQFVKTWILHNICHQIGIILQLIIKRYAMY